VHWANAEFQWTWLDESKVQANAGHFSGNQLRIWNKFYIIMMTNLTNLWPFLSLKFQLQPKNLPLEFVDWQTL